MDSPIFVQAKAHELGNNVDIKFEQEQEQEKDFDHSNRLTKKLL